MGAGQEVNQELGQELDQDLIDEIVRRVLTVAKPSRIILFGSAATGQMTRDSDIDLLVVEDEPGDRRKRSVDIRRAIGNVGYPFDIIVMATEWYEESKSVIGGMAYPANKYGRPIYDVA